MKVLPPADRVCVRKAALLLRLARAINLGRGNAVRKQRLRMRNGGVEIELTSWPACQC